MFLCIPVYFSVSLHAKQMKIHKHSKLKRNKMLNPKPCRLEGRNYSPSAMVLLLLLEAMAPVPVPSCSRMEAVTFEVIDLFSGTSWVPPVCQALSSAAVLRRTKCWPHGASTVLVMSLELTFVRARGQKGNMSSTITQTDDQKLQVKFFKK